MPPNDGNGDQPEMPPTDDQPDMPPPEDNRMCDGASEGQFTADHFDCTKFYICSNGMQHMFQCSPMTVYSELITDVTEMGINMNFFEINLVYSEILKD
ncbi:hypothetical protein B4U80_13897 [Leptotrombidium deliense]|uniref:Chitin-binding type-2 domain-containing protein n=1 Tax=Leptotrombidium deliense TaxID=299467 RepID=A0A443S8H5_9ACAR|nr:hypothetical protein B4U80_13897 [Leptotrombidium deliense]